MIGNPNGQVGGEEGASGASSGCAMKDCRWVHRGESEGEKERTRGREWVEQREGEKESEREKGRWVAEWKKGRRSRGDREGEGRVCRVIQRRGEERTCAGEEGETLWKTKVEDEGLLWLQGGCCVRLAGSVALDGLWADVLLRLREGEVGMCGDGDERCDG
ncbi:hypothetical protein MRB53_026348 [Persea americana]|uniref:Uncharacterized protein n=1 Tax=Persea americana TaxID=3435 RepID=A0ACC2LHP8_PERAE|nr:hypothetical protein MRB53_026348 [Persea americana]